jgi:MFS family permease
MKILDFLAIISVLVQMFTLYIPLVIVSRLIMGFYCSITLGLIPSWIISMAPQRLSGLFGTFYYLAIVMGMAEAYCMGQFLDTSTMEDKYRLAIYIGMPVLTSIVHLIGLGLFGSDNIERLID